MTRAVRGPNGEPGDIDWLQPSDRERLSRLKHQGAAAQFYTGRTLLRQALNARGLNYADVDFSSEKPTHPAIHFNISHVLTLVAVALGENELGLDVETTDRNTNINLLMPRHFTAAETEWVERQSDLKRAFFRIWTLKEAFLKLMGTGLRTPTRSFEFDLDSGEFSPPTDIESSRFHYADFEECCLAITVREESRLALRHEAQLDWVVIG
jgi:4'-phosphopantetheinyl transferase